MKAQAIIVAALLSAGGAVAYAQTPSDHDSHHPSQSEAPAPAQPAAPSTQGSAGGPQNMMGQGMMSQGMMGQGGMMGGGNSMMSMMGSAMPMMGMAQVTTCAGGTCGMGGMATIDRIEGRIAFLKTELKIVDVQNDAWNAFADTLRTNARKLSELRASMTPQAGLADRLAWQDKWFTARADGTRAIRGAYLDLAAKLSDDQKTTAEQILVPHVGMMSMMSGMGAGPMGNMGNMSFGQMPGYRMMQGGVGPK